MTHHSLVRLLPAALLCSVTVVASPAFAQTGADNTKVNTRDREAGAVTADQQKENATDRDITKRIRQSVVSDKSLSSYAHNVKIVAQDGQVTLKGPVRTEAEKQAIESKATAVAGAGHVTNDITVTASSTAKPPKTPKQ
jgi:hyperosmotically inducible protein